MEMVLAFLAGVFAYNSLPFWLLVGLVTAFALYEVQNKNGDWAAAAIFLGALGCQFFGDVKPFTYVYNNPWTVGEYAIGYLFIGFVIYAPFIRWLFFVTDELNDLSDRMTEYLKAHGVKGSKMPPELMKDWAKYCHANGINVENPVPQISDNKQSYFRWSFMWAVDAPWTLARKPLRRISRFCYETLKGVMQNMADWFYAEMVKNFPAFQTTTPAAQAAAPDAAAQAAEVAKK